MTEHPTIIPAPAAPQDQVSYAAFFNSNGESSQPTNKAALQNAPYRRKASLAGTIGSDCTFTERTPDHVGEDGVMDISESRKTKRRQVKNLVFQLDSILPEEHRHNTPMMKRSGARAFGMGGRTLFAVLTDTIEYLRKIKARQQASAHAARRRACVYRALAIEDETLREGMRSSQSLVLMEVSMPGWTIQNINVTAQELLGSPPWGDSSGQCLLNALVHRDDLLALKEMWQQNLCAQGLSELAARDAAHDGTALVPPPNVRPRRLRICCYKCRDLSPVLDTASMPKANTHHEDIRPDALSPFSDQGMLFEEDPHLPDLEAASPPSGEDDSPNQRICVMELASLDVTLFPVPATSDGVPQMLLLGVLPSSTGGGVHVLRGACAETADKLSDEHAPQRVSREDLYFSGVYRFHMAEGMANVNIGDMRNYISAHLKTTHAMDEEEVTIFGKMLQTTRTLFDFSVKTMISVFIKWTQGHVHIDLDDTGVPFLCLHTRFDLFGLYQTPWKLKMYAPLSGLGATQRLANIKGFTDVEGKWEDPIKVHLSVHLPEASSSSKEEMRDGCWARAFSWQEMWLSPVLFPEFPSVFPSSFKAPEGTPSDSTPSDEGGTTGDKWPSSKVFALRIVEYCVAPCRSCIEQRGFLHGAGSYKFTYRRIADGDPNLISRFGQCKESVFVLPLFGIGTVPTNPA